LTEHERGTTLTIGAVSYTGYSFDQAWEFRAGHLDLAVRQGGRTLAEKSFTWSTAARRRRRPVRELLKVSSL